MSTESEWEYAARGSDGLIYPWGNEFDEDKVQGFHSVGFDTANVGNYSEGKSWVGALDMSGNVWEWTSSLYKDYPYVSNDVRELTGNESNVSEGVALRGGSFGGTTGLLRAAGRGGVTAGVDFSNVGFRCVRSNSVF